MAADNCGLRNISPEGLAGLFGGIALSLRAASGSSMIDSTKLPASLLKLGGPGGGGGGGGNSVAGKLTPLPPSLIDLLFLLPSLGFLNFHDSLSASRISSTPPLLLVKRPAFFAFGVGVVGVARLACSSARLAWISARERVAAGGGANIAAYISPTGGSKG
jgi:hypothetical protein